MNATICLVHVIPVRHSLIYAIKIFTETVLEKFLNIETREAQRNLGIFLIKR